MQTQISDLPAWSYRTSTLKQRDEQVPVMPSAQLQETRQEDWCSDAAPCKQFEIDSRAAAELIWSD